MYWIAILLFSYALTACAGEHSSAWTAEQALDRLQKGNERFVKGKPKAWNSGTDVREKLAAGQTPYACIISCADSRVPPEQIFDAGLGELFVIRVAGNVTPREVIASADYAVGHLNCPVVIVMGHSKCGAVAAALSESEFDEPLNSLVEEIRPVVEACHDKGYDADDLYEGAIKENARAGASELVAGSRAIEQAVTGGKCVVLSAVYDIESGAVNWQAQYSAVNWKNEPTDNSHTEHAAEVKPTLSTRTDKVASTKRESEHAARPNPNSAKQKH
ncbi:MAG: carbonic anhydrase [bacterium]|nr:carbonic anhydrase [bacterium]